MINYLVKGCATLFILEVLLFGLDCIKTKNQRIIRVYKFSAYLGMFMPLFSIWLYNAVIGDCKTKVDICMIVILIMVLNIAGIVLFVIRLNKIYSFQVIDKEIVAYRFFMKYSIDRGDILTTELKADGFKIVLKNGKKFKVEYIFEELDYLVDELKKMGINISI